MTAARYGAISTACSATRAALRARAMSVSAVGLAVTGLLCACQRDYEFHTVAVYEAPRGHYSIRIDGRGVVRAGHDVSEHSSGLITVSPSSGAGAAALAPVALKVALRGSQVYFGES